MSVLVTEDEMTDKTLDQKINTLQPGERVVLTSGNGLQVVAERSGNGQTLRIVRESARGFDVVSIQRF